jgi:ankyrin repeat protein
MFKAARDNADVVQILLDNGAVPRKDILSRTPLHWAAGEGYATVARLWLHHGYDVHERGPQAVTPLHLAARNGRMSTAQLLLEQGASSDIADENGATPLHYAVASGSVSVTRLLLEHDADVNVAVTGDINNEDMQLAPRFEGGDTPLHIAVAARRSKIIKMLLQRGANVNAMDNYSLTPLTIAVGKTTPGRGGAAPC